MKITTIIFLSILLLSSFLINFNRVLDNENVLTEEEEISLNELYNNHEELTTNQIFLITTQDIGNADNIQVYATQKGNDLGVGQKEKDNGVIIVYSGSLRKTSIATGLGVEEVFTDSIAKYVIQTHMIPNFKKGEVFEGLLNGSKWIIDFLEKPENKI